MNSRLFCRPEFLRVMRRLFAQPNHLLSSSSSIPSDDFLRSVLPKDASPLLTTPLTQVPSGLASAETITDVPANYNSTRPLSNQLTQVTKLSNGLRVATHPHVGGHFCTIGAVIDSGSRYELMFPSGVSHFIEKLAFQSSSNYASRDALLKLLEGVSGICDAQVGRDVAIYALSADVRGADLVVDVLSDSILRPTVTDTELVYAQRTIAAELETNEMSPMQEPKLTEWIHQAAFHANTLGLPRPCPVENIEKINKDTIFEFLRMHHQPQRMVVCGVGIEHESFVKMVEKHFFSKIPTWHKPNATDRKIDGSTAQYTGGVKKIEKDLSDVSLGPNPLPNLAHLVFGFESCSHKDEDFVPLCVLASLLGGGGSFSAGGPGKGMYSRLYLDVLNRYHWIHHAQATNTSYQDTGLFHMHFSADPAKLASVAEVMVQVLLEATSRKSYSDEEVSRAKSQLQSLLLMNLEQRPVTFEDTGRQVLFHGNRKPPSTYYDLIAKVTVDDLIRVAERLLLSKLSLVAFGDLKKLPAYELIQKSLTGDATKTAAKQRNIFKFFG